MTDTATAPASPDVSQKRRDSLVKARAAKAAKARPPTPVPTVSRPSYDDDQFEGLTATDCCDECHEKYCVITGQMTGRNPDGTKFVSAHCGHPNKGGIQAAHQMDPDIKKRYLRAKKFLKRLAVGDKTE